MLYGPLTSDYTPTRHVMYLRAQPTALRSQIKSYKLSAHLSSLSEPYSQKPLEQEHLPQGKGHHSEPLKLFYFLLASLFLSLNSKAAEILLLPPMWTILPTSVGCREGISTRHWSALKFLLLLRPCDNMWKCSWCHVKGKRSQMVMQIK